MKVALVAERYLPHVGGVEYSVATLTSTLSQMGVEVELFVAEPLREVGLTVEGSIRIQNLASIPFVSGIRFPVGLFRPLVGSFDVVHAHNYHSLATAALRHDYGAKRVLTPTFHGRGSTAFLDALHVPYRFMVGRWLREIDAVICLSHYEADKFGNAFPGLRHKISIVPAALRRRFPTGRISADSRSLLCIGRLVPYKRFDLAISALALLPDWTLCIAGDGPDRERLEGLAATLGVSSRVSFAGKVGDTVLGRLIDESACLIHMSLMESFGMSVLEAIASARPVVVAAGGAPAELANYFPDWMAQAELNDVSVAAAVRSITLGGSRKEPDTRPFEPRHVAEEHLRIYSR